MNYEDKIRKIKIWLAINKRGYNQTSLADELGISRQYMSLALKPLEKYLDQALEKISEIEKQEAGE